MADVGVRQFLQEKYKIAPDQITSPETGKILVGGKELNIEGVRYDPATSTHYAPSETAINKAYAQATLSPEEFQKQWGVPAQPATQPSEAAAGTPPAEAGTPQPAATQPIQKEVQTPATSTQYTVQAGDNLYAIAQKSGITLQDLVAANPQITNPDKVQAGQIITVPPKQQSAEPAQQTPEQPATPTQPTAPQAGQETPAGTTTPLVGSGQGYTVKAGDTLSAIAKTAGVSQDEILKANPDIVDPNKIQAGQTIKIPAPAAATPQPVAPTSEQPAAPTEKVETLPVEEGTEPAIAAGQEYSVKAGDTLTKIAKDNNTTIADIQKLNPDITDPNNIQVGQKIVLPQEAKAGVTVEASVETPISPKISETTTTAQTPTPATSGRVEDLGSLSSVYECGSETGNPGIIARNAGDVGGASYGSYQFASKTGTVNTFMDWLKTANPDYYNQLYTAYTTGGIGFGQNFDAAWKSIAEKDPAGFQKLQHDFAVLMYYEPIKKTVQNNAGIDIDTRSGAIQQVLFSTSIQHGANSDIFSRIDWTKTDEEIIKQIYDMRRSKIKASGNSQAIKDGVLRRYDDEQARALSLLKSSQAEKPTVAVASGDTLGSIAKNNDTTVDAILKANPEITDANKITVGQTIALPEEQPTKAEIPVTETVTTKEPEIVTIKPGDTLSKIATEKNTTVEEIQKSNPEITDPNKIQVGQEIKLPTATQPVEEPGTVVAEEQPKAPENTGGINVTSADSAVNTRDLRVVDSQPIDKVPLAEALRNEGVSVEWEEGTGNIIADGEPLKYADIQGSELYDGHVYSSQEQVDKIVAQKQPVVPKEEVAAEEVAPGEKVIAQEEAPVPEEPKEPAKIEYTSVDNPSDTSTYKPVDAIPTDKVPLAKTLTEAGLSVVWDKDTKSIIVNGAQLRAADIKGAVSFENTGYITQAQADSIIRRYKNLKPGDTPKPAGLAPSAYVRQLDKVPEGYVGVRDMAEKEGFPVKYDDATGETYIGNYKITYDDYADAVGMEGKNYVSQEKMKEIMRKALPEGVHLPSDLKDQGFIQLRGEMQNQYGIGEAGLTWNEETRKPQLFGVDMDDTGWMKGSDGRYYVKQEDLDKAVKMYAPTYLGNTAVRDYLKAYYGLTDGQIQFSQGKVTIDGVPLDLPEGYVAADGKFYAGQKVLDQAMTEAGKTPVRMSPQHQQEIYQQLQQALEKINTPYDVTTDPAYQQAVAESNRAIMEEFSKRGIVLGTEMTDRMYQTAILLAPKFEELAHQKTMQQIQATMQVLGQMGALDDQMLNFATYNLSQSKWLQEQAWAEKEMQMKEEETAVQRAWERVETLGYVDNNAAVVLGLPVGTPSAAARQKVEQLEDLFAGRDYEFEKQKMEAELNWQYYLRQLDAQAARSFSSGGGTSYGGGGTSGTGGGSLAAGTIPQTPEEQQQTVALTKEQYNSIQASLKSKVSNGQMLPSQAYDLIRQEDAMSQTQKDTMISSLKKSFDAQYKTWGGFEISLEEYNRRIMAGETPPKGLVQQGAEAVWGWASSLF